MIRKNGALTNVFLALFVPFLLGQNYDCQASSDGADYRQLSFHGSSLNSTGHYAEALECFRKAEELKGDDWYIESGYGFSLSHLNQQQEAFSHYARAYKIDPDKPTSITNLAQCYSSFNNYGPAIDLCSRYLANHPDLTDANYDVLMMQGYLYAVTKHGKSSYEAYRKALQIHPDNEGAWSKAANDVGFAGDGQDAELLIDEFGRRFPKSSLLPALRALIPGLRQRMADETFSSNRQQVQQAALREEQSKRGRDRVDAFVIVKGTGTDIPTENVVALVKHGLRQLPPLFVDQLAAAEVHVIIAPHLTDVLPDVLKDRPRGWGSNATWHNANGTYDYQRKWIVVGTKYTNIFTGKEIVDPTPDQTVLHELGHCYDYFLGTAQSSNGSRGGQEQYTSFSHSRRFVIAYEADCSKIKDQAIRARLMYFLQPGDAGKEELFAQLFPCFYNNIRQPGSPQELFSQYFPTVLSTMKDAFSTDLEWQKLFGKNVKMYK